MVKSGQHGERPGETHRKSGPDQGSVQQECRAMRVACQGRLGVWKNVWATSTAWLPIPLSQPHSPSQPPLITTLTSEGTEAWTYTCFRHDVQTVSTVIGRIVTETGVVGQGQNDQLHPDSLFPLLHNKQGRTGICVPTTLVHNQTIITFPTKASW